MLQRYVKWVKKRLKNPRLFSLGFLFYAKYQKYKLLYLDVEGFFFIPEGVQRYVEWVKKRLKNPKLESLGFLFYAKYSNLSIELVG